MFLTNFVDQDLIIAQKCKFFIKNWASHAKVTSQISVDSIYAYKAFKILDLKVGGGHKHRAYLCPPPSEKWGGGICPPPRFLR